MSALLTGDLNPLCFCQILLYAWGLGAQAMLLLMRPPFSDGRLTTYQIINNLSDDLIGCIALNP